jgi:hypothetical protein
MPQEPDISKKLEPTGLVADSFRAGKTLRVTFLRAK